MTEKEILYENKEIITLKILVLDINYNYIHINYAFRVYFEIYPQLFFKMLVVIREECCLDIGSQLRSLLEQDGITQKQLADALNISTTTLNGYIKNRRQPDAKTVIRLASYFNTTTDYIYGISTLREIASSPYSAEERHLVNIFRGIPEDKRPLYIETGRTFSNFGKKRKSPKVHL